MSWGLIFRFLVICFLSTISHVTRRGSEDSKCYAMLGWGWVLEVPWRPDTQVAVALEGSVWDFQSWWCWGGKDAPFLAFVLQALLLPACCIHCSEQLCISWKTMHDWVTLPYPWRKAATDLHSFQGLHVSVGPSESHSSRSSPCCRHLVANFFVPVPSPRVKLATLLVSCVLYLQMVVFKLSWNNHWLSGALRTGFD